MAGVQRGGRGEVECEREARREREARSLGARRERAPIDRASRSHSTSPLPPLCTPATQATSSYAYKVNARKEYSPQLPSFGPLHDNKENVKRLFCPLSL